MDHINFVSLSLSLLFKGSSLYLVFCFFSPSLFLTFKHLSFSLSFFTSLFLLTLTYNFLRFTFSIYSESLCFSLSFSFTSFCMSPCIFFFVYLPSIFFPTFLSLSLSFFLSHCQCFLMLLSIYLSKYVLLIHKNISIFFNEIKILKAKNTSECKIGRLYSHKYKPRTVTVIYTKASLIYQGTLGISEHF